MDLFALAKVPAGPDEAGGPPPTKFYTGRDNVYQADLFLSGDKAIVEILNRTRTASPMPLAVAELMAPHTDPVEQVEEAIQRHGTTH